MNFINAASRCSGEQSLSCSRAMRSASAWPDAISSRFSIIVFATSFSKSDLDSNFAPRGLSWNLQSFVCRQINGGPCFAEPTPIRIEFCGIEFCEPVIARASLLPAFWRVVNHRRFLGSDGWLVMLPAYPAALIRSVFQPHRHGQPKQAASDYH